MRIPLDRQSKVPLYQQIGTFLQESIQSGSLACSARLPAIRRMAEDLGVNRITVENAYAALWEERVTFAPGRAFFPTAQADNSYMRLNFAAQSPDNITEGIKRLGQAIAKLDAEQDDATSIWHDSY